MTEAAWVLGASGLLGKAVTRALGSHSSAPFVQAQPMDWKNAANFDAQTDVALRALAAAGGDWTIYWCAGAGVVGTSQAVLAAELEQLRRFLAILTEAIPRHGLTGRGCLFYASSAGAVYAGSENPPFTEDTPPHAISPYGDAKLLAEQALQEFSMTQGVPLLVGRISNLYGPDQSLDKAQGLLSQLCKSAINGAPTNIYVSLDTIRDYINADDCAALIIDTVERQREVAAVQGIFRVKILASHQAVTIGAILGIFRSIFKRRPHAMIGTSPHSALQVRDLSLRSVVWTDLDDRHLLPLAVGIHAIWQSLMVRVTRASL